MKKKSPWVGLALMSLLVWVRPSVAESCHQSIRQAGSHAWKYQFTEYSGCGIGCGSGYTKWSTKTRLDEGYQVKDSTINFHRSVNLDTTVHVEVYPFSVTSPNESYCGDAVDSLAFEGDSVFFARIMNTVDPDFIFSKRLGLVEWRKGFLSSHGNGGYSYNRLLTYNGDSLGIQRMVQVVRFAASGIRPAQSATFRRSSDERVLPPGVVQYRTRAHTLSGKLLPE